MQRDNYRCIYCLHSKQKLVNGTDAHHIFGRARVDEPDAIITLCHECHMSHHNGKNPTTIELVDLMESRYGINLREKYPEHIKTTVVSNSPGQP